MEMKKGVYKVGPNSVSVLADSVDEARTLAEKYLFEDCKGYENVRLEYDHTDGFVPGAWFEFRMEAK